MNKKILLSIFILIGFPILAFGKVIENQFYTISDFSKMLESHVSPYLVGSKGGIEAINLRANTEYGALSKREPLLLYGNCRNAPVKTLHRFYKSDNTSYLLVFSSTYLDLGDDNGGSCTELRSGLTDGKRWSCLTYKDLAICGNGSDRAIKYDGHTQTTADTDGSRTAGNLVADLGAPFAELNTGTDLDASSWYQYKVAFYDGANYYYSDARSNAIQTGSTVHNITLTDIPLGPAGTTTRYIYRTLGNASKSAVEADNNFYLVATINDNTTRTYNDSMDDTTASGDASPTWSTVSAGYEVTPPKGRFLLIHKERLFMANDPSGTSYGKSTIYWSDILNPDFFDVSSNYELIRPDDGDEITFIKNLLGQLVIGKTNTIEKFYTDASSPTNWELSNPISKIGSPSPYGVVNSSIGIIYPSRYGLFSFNGQRSQLLSDIITKDYRDIDSSSFEDIVGVFYDNKYYMSYTSSSSGAGENNRVLVLDIVRNSFVKDTVNADSFCVFNSGLDFGPLYVGSSVSDGKIMAYSQKPQSLVVRYKSDLEDGTSTWISYLGTETEPSFELGWGKTIDDSYFAGKTIDDASFANSIIDRYGTSGNWVSKGYQINASDLSKLYWNEELSVGGVTWAIRTASTESGLSSASWSSEFSDPNGSDVSGVTANTWIQFRASLSTTDINYSPQVVSENNYMMKLVYTKEGDIAESSVNSYFETGWLDFNPDVSEYPKRIRQIIIYYEGTEGQINFEYKNVNGDIDKTFTIDLSVNPDDDSGDNYRGTSENKVYDYIPPVMLGEDFPVGRLWKFIISDTGTSTWKIRRIVVRYDIEEYYEE